MVTKMRIPKRLFYIDSHNLMIHSMIMEWKSRDEILKQAGYSGRSVFGYKLPEWQRKEKWSDDQCIKFIQSLYKGINPGAFMFNMSSVNHALDLILLDGQQRLRALERYLTGDLAVPGDDGIAHLWTDLEEGEQAHLKRMLFGSCVTHYSTEEECVTAYNLHNFGGTPHAEDERAQINAPTS